MRFWKLVLAALLLVCFMLAVQPAKAGTIIFDDNTQEGFVTVTWTATPGLGETATIVVGSPCNEQTGNTAVANGACVFTFSKSGFTSPAQTNLPFTFALSEPGTTPAQESDTLDSSLVGGSPQMTFNSDRLVNGTEAPLGPCPVTGVTCTPETGDAQFAGAISWQGSSATNIETDNVFVRSDLNIVPEPSSLILLGSGLALAGGFLRRRRRLVTPSVVA